MPLSAFLPATFDARRPVALIAGQGVYPILVAAAVRAAGIPLRLIAFEEETRPELVSSFTAKEHRMLKVGQLGHMLDALKEFGAGSATMAGQITPRRFSSSDRKWNLLSGPRILYEPMRWNSSALSRTSNPVRALSMREVTSGVCLTFVPMRARASSKTEAGGRFISDVAGAGHARPLHEYRYDPPAFLGVVLFAAPLAFFSTLPPVSSFLPRPPSAPRRRSPIDRFFGWSGVSPWRLE